MKMPRTAIVLVALATLGAVPAQAQKLPPGGRAAALRGRVEDAFGRRIQQELGLSDDQAAKVQRVTVTWATRRRALEQQERRLRQSLNGQLRPGVAANPDSVASYVDELNANRVAYAQSFRDEMKDLSTLLSPVQRGQFQLLRDRVLARVQELQQQRPTAP